MASAFQYCLILAHKKGELETEEGSRGGAALLLNKRSFEAGAEEDQITTEHDGRLAIREVAWEGMIFKISSMYAPAEADYRKRFINKLHRTSTLDKETIIGGDFNCVINISHDVQYSDERRQRRPYANMHGPLMTKLMNKAKLSDTHNRVNGENTGGYTREGRDIRTRIDRIYARENNSSLAWESSEINYDIVARIHTDHLPVIATAAALGRSKNKPHQSRINTEVLFDPGTRQDILTDMEDAISKHEGWEGYKAKKVWEQFKLNAYATLKRLTKQKASTK